MPLDKLPSCYDAIAPAEAWSSIQVHSVDQSFQDSSRAQDIIQSTMVILGMQSIQVPHSTLPDSQVPEDPLSVDKATQHLLGYIETRQNGRRDGPGPLKGTSEGMKYRKSRERLPDGEARD